MDTYDYDPFNDGLQDAVDAKVALNRSTSSEDTLEEELIELELNDLHRERDAAHDAGDTETVLEIERQIQVLEDELAEVLAPFGGTVRSR